MRQFIIDALKGRTTPDFSLADLAARGRMDLICETVANALFISNGIRKDTRIHIALSGPRDPPKLLTFDGATLRGVDTDTPSIARIILKSLGPRLKLNEHQDILPGVTVTKKAFEPLVKEAAQTTQLFYLHPDGKDIRTVTFTTNVTFVLGDFIGLPRNTEKLLDRLGAQKVTLGPRLLYTAHCPIIVHNELDRREDRPQGL